MTRGIIVEWRLWIVVGLLGFSTCASGQGWQTYQLTNFTPPGQVKECSSVADTLGSLHHYLYCTLINGDPANQPMYYLRTDYYGNILSDTVRLNGFVGNQPQPRCIRAVGNGSHSWCVFGERIPSEQTRGLFLTERDENGEEVMPPTFLGYDMAWEGWNTSAVMDPVNNIIHLVGTDIYPCYYHRFTTTAETLQWQRPINGMLDEGLNTSMILSPLDGLPWAAMSTVDLSGGGQFLIVRFNEDTSQTSFVAMEGSSAGPAAHGFGMDANGHADFIVGSSGDAATYVRLDSTFQIPLDNYTISHNITGHSGIMTDVSGNCLAIWDGYPELRCGFRRADGVWTPPIGVIDPIMNAQFFSVVKIDTSRFAFTCMAYRQGDDFSQLRLYTYGFPPNSLDTTAGSWRSRVEDFRSSF